MTQNHGNGTSLLMRNSFSTPSVNKVKENSREISKSSSFDDNWSKSSCSLSQTSQSSSDKEKCGHKFKYNFDNFNDIHQNCTSDVARNRVLPYGKHFSRQTSQVSTASSLISWTSSELPNTSTSASRCTSTSESMFEDTDNASSLNSRNGFFKEYQRMNNIGPTRHRSASGESICGQPYAQRKPGGEMKKRRHRDLIIQDEEEEFPFAKHTFNKKKGADEADSSDRKSSVSSSLSQRSSSQDSIYSVGLMNQFMLLHKNKMKQKSSGSSLASSFTDINHSISLEDSGSFIYSDGEWRYRQQSQGMFNNTGANVNMGVHSDMPYHHQGPYPYRGFGYPTVPSPNPSSFVNKIGLKEAVSILPERFLKSWLEKALLSQQEEYFKHMMMSQQYQNMPHSMGYSCNSSYYVDDSDLPPSVSAQTSMTSTPKYGNSLENIYANVHPSSLNPSNLIRHKSFLRTSVSQGSTDMTSSDRKISLTCLSSNVDANAELHESSLFNVGALPLKKENSFDKLKRILQNTDTSHYRDRSTKRFMFAANHQKSLPLFLETLSEEDEEKRRSRTPSFDKEQKNATIKSSKMKSFLKEEKFCSSSASENQSDCTGSVDNDVGVKKPLGRSYSFVLMESDDSYSTCSSSSRNEKDTDTDQGARQRKISAYSIPSIVVSQKYGNDNLGTVNSAILDSSTERRTVQKLSNSRPTSPNPDNQNADENTVHSKDSLEIDEIMSPKEGKSFVSTLQKIDSVSSTKDRDSSSADILNFNTEQTSTYLSIFDIDDKYLSPSPSVATPSIMSPITVIEVAKLDNQADCLDGEEPKDLEPVNNTGDKSLGDNSNNGQDHLRKTKKALNRFPAPKCLKLKRYLVSSGSENVFTDSLDNGKRDVASIGVQADDDSLIPLIKLTNISKFLKQLLRNMPQLTEEKMFVVVQDKGIQCEDNSHRNCEKELKPDILDISKFQGTSGGFDGRCEEHSSMATQTNIGTDSANDLLYEDVRDAGESVTFPQTFISKINVTPAIYSEDVTDDLGRQKVYKSELNIYVKGNSLEMMNTVVKEGIQEEIKIKEHSTFFPIVNKNQMSELDHNGQVDMPKMNQQLSRQFSGSSTVGIVRENIGNSKQPNDGSELSLTLSENAREDLECSQAKSDSMVLTSLQTRLCAHRIHYENVDAKDMEKLCLHTDTDKTDSEKLFTEKLFNDVEYTDDYVKENERTSLDFSKHTKCHCSTGVNTQSKSADSHTKAYADKNDNLNASCAKRKTRDVNEKAFDHFHSAFYIHLRNDCPSKCNSLSNLQNDDVQFSVKTENLHGHKVRNEIENCNGNIIGGRSNGSIATSDSNAKSENIESIEDTNNSPENSEKPKSRSELYIRLSVPKVDSGFNSSKSMSDGDRSTNDLNIDFEENTNETIAEGANSEQVNDWNEKKRVSYTNVQATGITGNRVKVIKNENSNDVSYILNATKTDKFRCYHEEESKVEKSFEVMNLNGEKEQLHAHDVQNVAATMQLVDNTTQWDNVFTNMDDSLPQSRSSSDGTETKNLIITTRSLDFETEDSRRMILHRSQKTAFSKTVDIGDFDVNHGESEGISEDQNLSLFSDNNAQDDAMLQFGMRYNQDIDGFDVFGRIKVFFDQQEETDSMANNIDNASVADTVDSLLDEIFESNTHFLVENDGTFDIFQQINEDDGHERTADIDNDCRTKETLDEIERLYNLNVLHQQDNMGVAVKYDSAIPGNISNVNTTDSSKEVSEKMLQQVETEIQRLDSYLDRYQYSEIHLCKNCGHSVRIPCAGKVTESVVHDFCQECSPLNLTAEMLEQRRQAKMAMKHYSVG